MTATVAAWIALSAAAIVAAGVVVVLRRRAQARRAYGPQGLGEALERARHRVHQRPPDDQGRG